MKLLMHLIIAFYFILKYELMNLIIYFYCNEFNYFSVFNVLNSMTEMQNRRY